MTPMATPRGKTMDGMTLTEAATIIAARSARIYLEQHNLKAESPESLAESLQAMVKFRLPEALRDAKEALDCHMDKAAEATFATTMAEAGIDAAKEAGIPACAAAGGPAGGLRTGIEYEIPAAACLCVARRQAIAAAGPARTAAGRGAQ